MRHRHSYSPFRLAIVARQESDGYVDALLGLARDQIVERRPAISHRLSKARFHPDPRIPSAVPAARDRVIPFRKAC
jgi:hypothetical protein